MIAMSAMFLVGCTSGSDKPEKERFIDATVEAACMVFDSGADLSDPSIDWEAKTKEVFTKHGFPADDDAKMEEIAAKYENDTDVQTAVEKALEECAGDLMKAFGDSLGGAEEGAATEEVPATTEEAPATEATPAVTTETAPATEAPKTE